jgi:pimeloyl-ACP methyl ester carboxylesterase
LELHETLDFRNVKIYGNEYLHEVYSIGNS